MYIDLSLIPFCQFIHLSICHIIYTTCVINLCLIKRVMLHQILPVQTIFDTAHRLNASMTYFRRFDSTLNIHVTTCIYSLPKIDIIGFCQNFKLQI